MKGNKGCKLMKVQDVQQSTFGCILVLVGCKLMKVQDVQQSQQTLLARRSGCELMKVRDGQQLLRLLSPLGNTPPHCPFVAIVTPVWDKEQLLIHIDLS